MRAISSVGQSIRLITGESGVRVPDGPFAFITYSMAQWLSWLERRPVTPEVEGSSPFWVVSKLTCETLCDYDYSEWVYCLYDNIPGRIAQLGEHLPYKQGVTGSSPVAPI